jgi:hypothetical protein
MIKDKVTYREGIELRRPTDSYRMPARCDGQWRRAAIQGGTPQRTEQRTWTRGRGWTPASPDKHAGTLHCETECSKGTTFFIRLPINAPGRQ